MSAGWPGSMCCAVVATRCKRSCAFDLLELDGTDLRREVGGAQGHTRRVSCRRAATGPDVSTSTWPTTAG